MHLYSRVQVSVRETTRIYVILLLIKGSQFDWQQHFVVNSEKSSERFITVWIEQEPNPETEVNLKILLDWYAIILKSYTVINKMLHKKLCYDVNYKQFFVFGDFAVLKQFSR